MTRWILAFAAAMMLGMLAVGCSDTEQPTPPAPAAPATSLSLVPTTAERVVNVLATLDAAFMNSDRLVFLSWNGHYHGTDMDADIELRANGVVVVTEAGYALAVFDGSYSITTANDGMPSQLVISLNDYDGAWPEMALYTDQSSLLLLPVEDSTGITFPEFWRFRQIESPAQEQSTK